MLKYFTDKDTDKSIAINPEAVKFIIEHAGGTKVVFNDSGYIHVTDSYLETVARLSER